VLGHEIGMLSEAIAGAFDLDDDGVMQQPVEQRGGDDGIAEHVAPFGKAAVTATRRSRLYAALALPTERRQRDRQHLHFVAKQPCLVCGRQPCDPIIFKRSATSSQYRSAAPITASSRAPEKNSIGGRD
jgi:hypothetical protein